jgi:hypothetical protein
MQRLIRRGAALVALFALAGCGLDMEVVEEPGAGEVEIGPQQTLEIETWNGAVEVNACPGFRVRATWVKRGAGSTKEAARADLPNVEVVLEKKADGVRLRARRTDGSTSGASGASLTACVPPGTRVIAKTRNGRVKVRAGAAVTATTSNGAIDVADAVGAVKVLTQNGAVTVIGEGLVVDAETSNGAVRVEGALAAGEHRLRTSNGAVRVALPGDARFALRAETSNGSVSSDFALMPRIEGRMRSVDAATGPDAGTKLSIATSNGSIEVRKRE